MASYSISINRAINAQASRHCAAHRRHDKRYFDVCDGDIYDISRYHRPLKQADRKTARCKPACQRIRCGLLYFSVLNEELSAIVDRIVEERAASFRRRVAGMSKL